ncbi:MAG: hypothetical protein QXF12_03340 [Candidatus Aenigmatarchaeota archaeon]
MLPLLKGVFSTAISRVDNATLENLKRDIRMSCTEKTHHDAFGYQINVGCDELDQTLNFSDLVSSKIAESIYYSAGDCNFIVCIESNPTYTITYGFRNHFANIKNISLAVCIISAALILVMGKGDLLSRLIGIVLMMVVVCLPVLFVDFLVSNLQNKMTGNMDLVYPIVENFVTTIKQRFIPVLIFSVIFLIALIIFKVLIKKIKKQA